MPQIDMSEAILDAEIVDTFTVIRRPFTVGSNGRVVITPTAINNLVGMVAAPKPSSLDRRPDMQLAPKNIDVITQFELYAQSNSAAHITYQPDLVAWHGSSYLVKSLSDFSGYGPGFISANCELWDSNATPSGDGA